MVMDCLCLHISGVSKLQWTYFLFTAVVTILSNSSLNYSVDRCWSDGVLNKSSMSGLASFIRCRGHAAKLQFVNSIRAHLLSLQYFFLMHYHNLR